MDLTFFAQVIVSGLATGAVYALVGMGYTVVFSSTRIFNLAQGQALMLGIMFTWQNGVGSENDRAGGHWNEAFVEGDVSGVLLHHKARMTKWAEIEGAAAQVRSAKAHLGSQEMQVAYSRIESPISGIVADRPLNAGEMANTGSPLITVVNISRVVARVNVPQSEASAVKIGQSATVTQPDTTEQMEGKVKVVSPEADPTPARWCESAGRCRG